MKENKKIKLTLNLPQWVIDYWQEEASKKGRTVGEVIADVLERWAIYHSK